jgi:hypothetical protein
MPSNLRPEPWKSFFSEIDASLEKEVVLHCLGGFVMTMLYGLDRPTADVDILPVGSNAATESLIGFGRRRFTTSQEITKSISRLLVWRRFLITTRIG